MKNIVILLLIFLTCLAVPTMANTGEVKDLMELLNLDWAVFAELAAAVALITEAFKRRLSTIFVGGWKTHVLTAVVGTALSMFVAWGDIRTIVIMSVGLYLFPVTAVGAGKSLLEAFGFLTKTDKPKRTIGYGKNK